MTPAITSHSWGFVEAGRPGCQFARAWPDPYARTFASKMALVTMAFGAVLPGSSSSERGRNGLATSVKVSHPEMDRRNFVLSIDQGNPFCCYPIFDPPTLGKTVLVSQ